ncbi:MAG TPA: hypothetical protein VF584_06715 [Longimicrobium sp.]|jgi:hypothetical protein
MNTDVPPDALPSTFASGETAAGENGHRARLKVRVETARQEAERGLNSRLTRHWPDVLAVTAVVALVARVAYVLMTGAGREKPAHLPLAYADLPAFTVLQLGHMAPLEGKADLLRKKLAGRFLLRPVRKGSPVREAVLAPASLAASLLQGRHVLPLQLPAGAAPDSLRAGDLANLLLSPATPAPGASPVFVQRVPVLAVSAAGDGMRVVVAVDRGQLDALAPRLGTSRVFVLAGGGAEPAAPTTARDSVRTPADSTAGGG